MTMNVAALRHTTSLDYCRGTLLSHHDGLVECTSQLCADLDQLRHELIIDCGLVSDSCGCVEVPYSEALPWAS